MKPLRFFDWLFGTGNLFVGICAVLQSFRLGELWLLVIGLICLGLATAFVMTDHTQ